MKLTILYFNDVHGYLWAHPELFYEGNKEVARTAGGYARLAGYIKQIKNTGHPMLVFDGGDTFHGTLPVVESKGEAVVPILNSMGIDAMVGHWDFAYGPQHLKKLEAQLSYPVLGMNIYKENGTLFLPPYIIKEVKGLKVGVIGICSNIIDNMPPEFSKGLKVTDGLKELPAYIDEVKHKGAHIVFLLSHLGFPQDCELLNKVDGIDICLSAHTHNRLYRVETVNNTSVIQCGCHGSFIGQLDLELDDKKMTGHQYELKAIDENFPVDEGVNQQVDEALQPYRPMFEKVVGQTPLILHRYNTLNSRMDNLLLAALLHATQADVAFSNGWRYGAPISEGEITRMDLFNIIPMNPPVSTVELSGEEIKTTLEKNLERTFAAKGLQQIGGYVKRCMGLTAHIRIENPAGKRIQELYIGNEHYDADKTYKAAFVTVQGVPKKLGANRRQTKTKAVEAMEMFLREEKLTEDIIKQRAFITV